jgi:hypothetical protein
VVTLFGCLSGLHWCRPFVESGIPLMCLTTDETVRNIRIRLRRSAKR